VSAFESFHLHLAYAAGNTAQVAAVAAFKTALIAAGASSTCSSTADTADLFCYSQTINSFDSASKQDPFYNQDFFAFVGNSYFASALTFAMRSRMADLATTYNVDVFVHPNSGCPGLDHLRWSLFFEQQGFPFNTCPFWFQQVCGFYARRALAAPPPVLALPQPGGGSVAGARAPAVAAASHAEKSAAGADAEESAAGADAEGAAAAGGAGADAGGGVMALLAGEPSLVLLSRGSRAGVSGGGGGAEAEPPLGGGRSLSTSSVTYSTAACANSSTWQYMLYVVWNTQSADDLAAKETLLDQFALLAGVTRGAGGSCATYSRTPAGAGATIMMCTEVTASAPTNFFPWPFGYAAIYVPKAYLAWATAWLMRNHDYSALSSSASYSLPFFVTPLSGCTLYDFDIWSLRSANNTVPFNYYPLVSPAAAFATPRVGGNSSQRIVLANNLSACTATGWAIYAPYLLNNLYSTANTPSFTATWAAQVASEMAASGGSLTTNSDSTTYNSATLPTTTAFYKYTLTTTASSTTSTTAFAQALKYALMYSSASSVDATFGIYSQTILLARTSNCADVDTLIYSGYSGPFDYPYNREALSVASVFGSRRRRLDALDGDGLRAELAAALAAERARAPGARALTSAACTTTFAASDSLASWTLHVTYVANNPTSVAAATAACAAIGSASGFSCAASTTTYTPGATPSQGWSTLASVGWASPATTASLASPAGLANEYSFVLNVPDASLHSVLSLVMAYTASSGTDLSANLGWVLLPNIATTGGCTVADRYASYYMTQGRRGYTVTSGTGTGTSTSTDSGSGSGSSAALSGGAIAGIVIGSVAAAALIAAGVAFAVLKTKSAAAAKLAAVHAPSAEAAEVADKAAAVAVA
jgi:hypothetical protein